MGAYKPRKRKLQGKELVSKIFEEVILGSYLQLNPRGELASRPEIVFPNSVDDSQISNAIAFSFGAASPLTLAEANLELFYDLCFPTELLELGEGMVLKLKRSLPQLPHLLLSVKPILNLLEQPSSLLFA